MKPRLPKPTRITISHTDRQTRFLKHMVDSDTDFPVEIGTRLYLPTELGPSSDTLFAVSSSPSAERLIDCNSVGFGGTCSPTADGVLITEFLAQLPISIQRDAVVVSGGVIGVDQVAHMGALDKDGQTIAVLANPPDYGIHPYVPERLFLEKCIRTRGGALISEYDTFADDRTQRLKERDRVIAWLSDVFVVIESSADSETVDTAVRARLQGNHVVAIDWTKMEQIWHHPPRRDGNDFLIKNRLAQAFPFDPMGIHHAGFEFAFRAILESWWDYRRVVPSGNTQ